jgi:hypothetical protein
VDFVHQDALEYFAACGLRALPAEEVEHRARAFAWRDVCVLTAQLPDTPHHVLTSLVNAVASADLPQTARLLAAAPGAEEQVEAFLGTLRATLSDSASGEHESLEAVEAARLIGSDTAHDLLVDVLLSPVPTDRTRVRAVDRLVAMWRYGSADDRSRSADALRFALRSAIEGPHPTPVRIGAIEAVVDSRLGGLEAVLSDVVETGPPLVAHQAAEALSDLDALLPSRLAARPAELAAARLDHLARELPTLPGAADVWAAQDERVRLLTRLADPELLLRHRFDFGIADSVADSLVAFRIPHPPLDAVSRIAELEVRDARALAHVILTRHPELADPLVLSTAEDSPEHLLSIAAAAMRHAGPPAVDHVERLVSAWAEGTPPSGVEGMAALTHALLVEDPARGVPLVADVSRSLIAGEVPERLGWPWTTVVARARADMDIGALLRSGDTGRRTAIELLALADQHRDAGPRTAPGVEASQNGVLMRRPADGELWALAACAAGLVDALPDVLAFFAEHVTGSQVGTRSSGRYGLIDATGAADLLSAIGLLARDAHERGTQERAVAEVHRFLRDVPVAGAHPSAVLGRAIGLAYLGDWPPLLDALRDGDDRSAAAARNAVTRWHPGPFTPASLVDSGSAARWLATRLADALTTAQRSVIAELTSLLERAHGSVVR